MTTAIWIAAAVLVIATVWFLARGVRAAPAAPTQEDREGLEHLRDRLLAQLHELDVEEGDRNVDTAIATDERRRLEAELAQVLRSLGGSQEDSAASDAAESRQLWLATVFILALVVPLVSASLYLVKNGSALTQLAQGRTAAGSDGQMAVAAGQGQTGPVQVPPMVLKMVGRLEERLKEQPNDPQGWARLGRAYQVLGREDDAHQAYGRAYKLAPKNVNIVAAYAGFLMSRHAAHLPPEAIAVFRQLHTLEPKHPGALWALGFAAYQQRQFSEAVKYWEQLLALLPPDNEAVPQLKHALSIARAEAAKK